MATNYSLLSNAKMLNEEKINISVLNTIYKKYCTHKKFDSVMPLFDIEYQTNDIIGYYDYQKLVAFSMIGVYDDANIENYQFAWDYKKPKLRLGINSLKHECAYYKSLGYKNYFLGTVDHYKMQFDGYEELHGYN